MDVRPYSAADREACLGVFDSIAYGERIPFEEFLEALPGPYFVMEHDGTIVGCGGFQLEPSVAWLKWGMIHRDWQRRGLGRLLLMYRLKEINKAGGVQMVRAAAPLAVA